MTDAATLIDRYFTLAPQPDADEYFAQFTDQAVVEDEGKQRHGIAEIRAWRTEVPTVSYAVHDIAQTSTGHDARVDIAGDFPGSPVRLTFHFEFTRDGHISVLTIRI
ncbi:MAG: nuclear transport factor 2 family protein [Frankia sp.]